MRVFIHLLSIVLAPVLPASAQVITFEMIPGQGVPMDNQLVSTQFEADFGVTFTLLENDGTPADPSIGPRIARIGAGKTAFVGVLRDPTCDATGSTTDDTPADLERHGCWLLTDDGVHPGPRPFGLLISYTTPVDQAGGELVDVDGGPEAWEIAALDANQDPIAHPGNPVEIAFPGAGTGDGVTTAFSFDLGQPIHHIRLIYTGEASFGRGLAFDNFSPSSLPVPTETRTWGAIKDQFDDGP